MNLVSRAGLSGFNDSSDLNSGLDGVVATNDTNISSTDNEGALAGADKITVHKVLEGSSSNHTGEGVTRKRKRLFTGTSGDHKFLGTDKVVLVDALDKTNDVIGEHTLKESTESCPTEDKRWGNQKSALITHKPLHWCRAEPQQRGIHGPCYRGCGQFRIHEYQPRSLP